MKLQQKFRLAQDYNHPDTIVIVASYPARSDRSIKKIDAVASYTDHFARSFRSVANANNKQVVVLAQKTNSDDAWYKEGNMLVCRVWDKGSPQCFAQILGAIGTFFPQATDVLVQFEFHQFGAKLTTTLFPLFLTGLRALGKTITLVLHQVVDDIATLSGHLNIQKKSFQAKVFNTALRLFYQSASYLSHTIIVHNSVFARRLRSITHRKDISVVPHGLGAIPARFSKRQARRVLGYKKEDFIVMHFGFLTWYKGTDWLVDQFAKQTPKNMQLLVAGGISPNTKDEPYYQRFVRDIKTKIDACSAIRITGFVEDKEIPLYFAAADLVVLPYRALMSSSGPLAMTLAFKKPFLLSKTLIPYAHDPDFASALTQARLSTNDISFTLTAKDFWGRVLAVKRHPKRFNVFSRVLRQERLWPTIAQRFYTRVNDHALASTRKFAILQKDNFPQYAHT